MAKKTNAVQSNPDLNIHSNSNLSESISKEVCENNLNLNKQGTSITNISNTRTERKETDKQDEGGIFLILMFYYFQGCINYTF